MCAEKGLWDTSRRTPHKSTVNRTIRTQATSPAVAKCTNRQLFYALWHRLGDSAKGWEELHAMQCMGSAACTCKAKYATHACIMVRSGAIRPRTEGPAASPCRSARAQHQASIHVYLVLNRSDEKAWLHPFCGRKTLCFKRIRFGCMCKPGDNANL